MHKGGAMFTVRSKIARKILNYFFTNETKRMYVNELARLIEEEPKNTHRSLLSLLDAGMLASEYVGKERYFFLNRDNALIGEMKKIYLKSYGIEVLLRRALMSVKGLKEAYIFGSFAAGTQNPDSDIDLLLVGTHTTLDAEKVVRSVGKQVGREINTVNMSQGELFEKKKHKDQFVTSVFKSSTIRLI